MFYSLGSNYSVTHGDVTSPTGAGTAVTGSASLDTKGSYAQLTSSTSIQAAGFIVHHVKSTNNSTDTLIDIAIGGSGSEQIIVSNLLNSVVAFPGVQYFFPIGIPAGTRIAARLQAHAASRVDWIHVTLTNGHPSYAQVETWGADTAQSRGTSIDGGGTANTKSTYVQLVASTGFATKQVMFAIGNQGGATRSSNDFLFDVAVDIGGNKQIIFADMGLHNLVSQTPYPVVFGPYNMALPAGSNIYVRTQSLDNSVSITRSFDIVGYGIA